MNNSEIINNSYYYGIKLPPQINTPSLFKKPKKIRLF